MVKNESVSPTLSQRQLLSRSAQSESLAKSKLKVSAKYIPDYKALMRIAVDKQTITVMAQDCFNLIWNDEIETGMFETGAYNVYGRFMKGSKEKKFPLDSGKVHELRSLIESQVPHGLKSDEEWNKCVDMIHKRIIKLRAN